MKSVDVVVVGAGPAGMAAAMAVRRYGLSVTVVDEQFAPGGQIWRAVERAQDQDVILGHAYVEGREVARAFRDCGADYEPGGQVWRLEAGFRVYLTKDRKVEVLSSRALILATGAQERPVPFVGWTLPGVMTVGAAQILLKSAGQIPSGKVWIAGSGPLPLLYAVQFLRAGGKLAGYLDTTPRGQWRSSLRHFPKALEASGDLLKGLLWTIALRTSGTAVIGGIADLEAVGVEGLTGVSYRTRDGSQITADADTLLIHEGIVPNLHAALSLDCAVTWNDAQDSFSPVVDGWGETTISNLFVAGDGAGIAGAKAASLRGELAGIRVADKLGATSHTSADDAAAALTPKLRRQLAARPFLDALFKPRRQVFAPADGVIACRCEEITAGEIRGLAKVGQPGPNQIKAASRAGMGPCQGRQCGYTINRLISETQGRSPADVGFYHVRPPLKPVTLGELAQLAPQVSP
jgi:NADPH-dependent 2,4-dienoyl-CoA reductase/sulfur reductase-like enzyme